MVNLQDPGAIMVPNTLFRYEGSYVLSNTLTPNTGYWIQVSQASLAAFTAISQQTLRRVLRKLEELGLVESGYNKVRVLDRVGLARLCGYAAGDPA